jgi:hypothetical protein
MNLVLKNKFKWSKRNDMVEVMVRFFKWLSQFMAP